MPFAESQALGRYTRDIPFEIDRGVASRAALGLIVLASDQTIEHEFRQLAGLPGVGIYESRMYNPPQTTVESLRAMEKDITLGAQLILPGLDLDVMAFGCTSGSMVLGEDAVFRRIQAARPGVPCTTPVTGALAALERLAARKVAVLTPYGDAVNLAVAEYLVARGLQIVAFGSFSEENDHRAARTSTASIGRAVMALGADAQAEGVLVCCTSLRAAAVVVECERALGKPVTSANHAMAWHALRLAGITDAMPQWGRLFELPL